MEVLVIFVLLTIVVGVWASRWGRSGIGWGLMAFLLSPLITAIILLIVGRTEEAQQQTQVCADAGRAEELMHERAMQKLLDEGFEGSPEELSAAARTRLTGAAAA